MNRYIVSKGWEGFADRLESVSYALNLAIKYNRIVCIDWRDRMWSDGLLDFSTYFDLVEIPYVNNCGEIPPLLDTFPPFWRGGIGLVNDQWIYLLKPGIHPDLENESDDQAVWIHPGIHFRNIQAALLIRHLRFKEEIKNKISEKLRHIPTRYPIVHLRGTDRGETPEDTWQRLRHVAPIATVISDDKKLASRWMKESPQSYLVSKTLINSERSAVDLLPWELEINGLDKNSLNLQTLTDFIILARAKIAFAGNEDSHFFKLARVLHPLNIDSWFEQITAKSVYQTAYQGYYFFQRETASKKFDITHLTKLY